MNAPTCKVPPASDLSPISLVALVVFIHWPRTDLEAGPSSSTNSAAGRAVLVADIQHGLVVANNLELKSDRGLIAAAFRLHHQQCGLPSWEGFSRFILTSVMCKAMNRTLTGVLFQPYTAHASEKLTFFQPKWAQIPKKWPWSWTGRTESHHCARLRHRLSRSRSMW